MINESGILNINTKNLIYNYNFFKKLKKTSNVDCEYIDERLTTFEAKEILGENRVAEVDAHAAKILIDNWFDRSR